MKSRSVFFFLTIGILFISPKIYSQKMNASEIVNNLKPFQELLEALYQKELPHLEKQEGFIKIIKTTSSSYDFITLGLTSVSKEKDGSGDTRELLYCQIRFELNGDLLVLKEFYCENKSRAHELEKLIKKNKVTGQNWNVKSGLTFYDQKIYEYLRIADTIARRSENCASGDNYRPGAFSEILIYDEKIILSQINYMNSKSLAHKDSYSMRDLVFTIPLTTVTEEKLRFQEEQIGEMLILFSDRSAKSKKSCGDSIREQIELEKIAFDKK
jgi:hypothetical protein